MKDDPGNLKNLHDLVPPPDVGLWPLAPGWYVVAGLALLLMLYLSGKAWKRWKTNAYRRAALEELSRASDGLEVAEILRRTALVIAPREEIAAKSGEGWTDWLAARLSTPMPGDVRQQLAGGLYQSPGSLPLTESLRNYASEWIRHHLFNTDNTPASDHSS